MSHPDDQLLAYALGELSTEESASIEAHLDTCSECRAELHRLRAALVAVVETLPPAVPPSGGWEAIAARIAESPAPPLVVRDRPPARWQTFALVASVALLLLTGAWGISQQRELRALRNLRAEALTVNRWLAREDVEIGYLEPTSSPIGSVLFLADGRALLVLADAPAERQNYQAWGLREGQAVSLGVSGSRTIEVDSSGFDAIGISLEPAGGSEQPTNVLGGTPVL